MVSTWMGVCLGIDFNVFTLAHAFGFDSLRSEWNAPIYLYLVMLKDAITGRIRKHEHNFEEEHPHLA